MKGALKRVPRKDNEVLCASACVTMFLGGKHKTMHPQAALGVHRSRIDGPASCTPFTWRGHVADLSQTMRRIMIGSPWRLEAMLEWHAMRTSHDSITAIRGAQIAEVTDAGVVIAPAVWRPLGASSHDTAPEMRVSALATQITSKGAKE